MAGHSKWAQIKRKKAVTDSRRGQLWTKLLKEITVAARLGGGDPEGNARLRTAIQDAKSANVPNDNMDRAIKRGTGQLEGMSIEEATYEGYGPGGVAVLVETVTDNKNRTVSEIRHLFSKNGGNLGESGCVGWMFEKRGYFAIDNKEMSEEQFMEVALELGADDISIEDESYEIYTRP
ncbi:MAG: YebC/PmpR family DNA-binding transcriptional regulator, partial [Thermoanaerobaculia bacterium]